MDPGSTQSTNGYALLSFSFSIFLLHNYESPALPTDLHQIWVTCTYVDVRHHDMSFNVGSQNHVP